MTAALAIVFVFFSAFLNPTLFGAGALAMVTEAPLGPRAFLAWFGCLIGIYIFGQGIFTLRRRRRARVRAVSTIRDAGAGLLHVAGMAEGKIPLMAPISGKPCFYFRTAVWRNEDPAKENSLRSAPWKLVAEETIAKPFILNDTTGRILVDPQGADVDWPHDTYEEYGKTLLATHTDVPAALEDFLARHNVKPGAAVRVEEYVIGPGAEVFVRGMKCTNPEFRPTETPVPSNKPSRAKDAGIALRAESKSSGTKIVRLSAEPQNVPAQEMTMQSRLAAALTLARANAEAKTSDSIVIPGVTMTVAEEESVRPSAQQGTALLQEPETSAGMKTLPGERIGAVQGPEPNHPAFVVRKPHDGSAFTISNRIRPDSDSPSAVRAAALLIGGPLLALVSIGSLLATFGLL